MTMRIENCFTGDEVDESFLQNPIEQKIPAMTLLEALMKIVIESGKFSFLFHVILVVHPDWIKSRRTVYKRRQLLTTGFAYKEMTGWRKSMQW
jgi:hypothetical protein